MYKFILILLVAIVGFTITSMVEIPSANDKFKFTNKKSVSPFRIVSTVTDTKLSVKQSQVTINFNFSNGPVENQLVYMSINGLLENIDYTPGKAVTYDLTPGKYLFKIWGGPGFLEIFSDSIEFKPQTKSEAWVDMITTPQQVVAYKPVLYFHSDKQREFDLDVIPKGEFIFTYPSIEKGWKGNINTDGTLSVNGKNYPYLFWEAKQDYHFKPSTNGYHLKKDEYIAFLEKKCDELGFTATERTDFITFWGMKMQNHEELFVQFLFDDSCDQFAKLNFKEQPEVLRRVYICLSPWDNYFRPYLKDVLFESMPKSSYSVLEWGGYEFKIEENTFTAKTN